MDITKESLIQNRQTHLVSKCQNILLIILPSLTSLHYETLTEIRMGRDATEEEPIWYYAKAIFLSE